MEDQLQQRNINGVWKSLKTISGQKKPDSCAPGNQTWVYDLNLFFNRFDFTPDEDPGVAGPRPSSPSGGYFYGPTPLAYQLGIRVDDAIIFLLDTSLSHPEKPGSTVKIMFFGFSSAFDTVQPELQVDKLELMGVDQHLTSWILDYLTATVCEDSGLCARHGYLQYRGPTGNSPGTFPVHPVQRRFLPTIPHCHLQKFSDNSAIVCLIRDGLTEPTENLLRTL